MAAALPCLWGLVCTLEQGIPRFRALGRLHRAPEAVGPGQELARVDTMPSVGLAYTHQTGVLTPRS